MLIKKLIAAVSLLLSMPVTNACTTFFIHHNGKMIFGRNYDWMADAGIVCTNQRGLGDYTKWSIVYDLTERRSGLNQTGFSRSVHLIFLLSIFPAPHLQK